MKGCLKRQPFFVIGFVENDVCGFWFLALMGTASFYTVPTVRDGVKDTVYSRKQLQITIDNTFIIKTNLRIVFGLFLISKFALYLRFVKL